jgi:phosphoesterase RecJ-like protein
MNSLLSFEELAEVLTAPAKTLIIFHRSPDADAVGSAFSLCRILEQLGSSCYCICGEEVPQNLQFLMHGMQKSVLVESIPADFEPERVICVDTASIAQMGTLAEPFGASVDLVIDHHEEDVYYGTENYIRANAAATGEIIFDLVKHFASEERITVDEEMCVCLYAAISADTGCFRYSNVTPKTHIRAAELVSSGIDCAEINRRLFENKSLERLRAQSAAISNMELFANGKIAVVTFPYALKAALGLGDEELSGLVDIPRSLVGVEVALCIRQPLPEGKFRVSVRSNGEYDVAELCRKFDGGGHAKAAGCSLIAADIAEAMHRIVSAIRFE